MKNLLVIAMFAVTLTACSQDNLPEVSLDWSLTENTLQPPAGHAAVFTLTNTGSVALEPGWELYFSAIYVAQRPRFDSTQVIIEHLSGEWFRLQPVSVTEPLEPGASVSFAYSSPRFLNANTQFPEGPYLVLADSETTIPIRKYTTPRIELEEVAEHYAHTNRRVPTAERLYEQNEGLSLLNADAISPIIPTPVSMQRGEGYYTLPESAILHHAPIFATEAAIFADAFRGLLPAELRIAPSEEAHIRLQADDAIENPEGYRLSIDDTGIEIHASGLAGAHYGFQTLLGLLTAQWDEDVAIILPHIEIEDYPRFGFRGLFLDISRNFQEKEDILRLLDLMSYYKFNVFQLHLANDEAWRIEIPGLPELTEVAARRGHTETHRDNLHPSFASGPDPDHSPYGSGYLSTEDFIEILHYARDRHIQVIPEIVAPGHMRAAIMAMHARYDRFMAEGDENAANEFLLEHPEDTSEYLSVQRFRNNTMDVCMESSYRFYEHVLDAILAMYVDAGVDISTFHVGGDEVPRGVWTGSPA
ncbi:MAG: carbohydate-binding domain-containing protein, partial [Balneolales bacterium]|nr:carbohydate-binding domain-containing protein [Balneolales bacterium]